MLQVLRTAVVLGLLLAIVTGLLYPLVVIGAALCVFPRQAQGSLVLDKGRTLGSSLIGQSFDSPKYFWGRPSATSPFPYNAMAGGGSNQGPTNPALVDAVAQRIARLRAADPGNHAPVPIDLVTASASGLDPHISPAAADYQAERVARARGIPVEQVRQLIAAHREGPTLGIFGQARIHVLRLNLALDRGEGEKL